MGRDYEARTFLIKLGLFHSNLPTQAYGCGLLDWLCLFEPNAAVYSSGMQSLSNDKRNAQLTRKEHVMRSVAKTY
jgi:hypothetical protein